MPDVGVVPHSPPVHTCETLRELRGAACRCSDVRCVEGTLHRGERPIDLRVIAGKSACPGVVQRGSGPAITPACWRPLRIAFRGRCRRPASGARSIRGRSSGYSHVEGYLPGNIRLPIAQQGLIDPTSASTQTRGHGDVDGWGRTVFHATSRNPYLTCASRLPSTNMGFRFSLVVTDLLALIIRAYLSNQALNLAFGWAPGRS